MPLDLDKAVERELERLDAERENTASVDVTPEKIEAEIAVKRDSWTVAGYVRKWFGRPGKPEAGGRISKTWK